MMNEDIELMATAELTKLYLGKILAGGFFKNEALQPLEQELKDVLTTFFLRPIKPGTVYRFRHEISLEYNAAYQACQAVFQNPSAFLEQSQKLLQLLYSVSENQNIIEGEFYTAYFDRLKHKGSYASAIGIFKSESKDPFLTIGTQQRDMMMEKQEGISIHNIHKGALIYQVDSDGGLEVSIFDKNNNQNPARFWVDDFLNVQIKADKFYQTEQVLKLCKDFAAKGESELDGVGKADLLNRTMDYFETQESFSLPQFEVEVLQEEEVMQSFYEHREKFMEKTGVEELNEDFEISLPAIQKAKKYIRSVIKLDKNFHLYVHGRRDLIEGGFDEEKQMNYYKVFFKEEN
ncbi:MAG: nucleoid-associated protein [Cyclobacteriaceae bacterium]